MMKIYNLWRNPLKNCFRNWIGIFLVPMLLTCQQTNSAKTINTESIDWNALQFTCSKEQNPVFDDASDALFQRARALEKANNAANDAEMVRLYQQAAKHGHYKALLNLAGLYIHGTGVAVDEGKAVDLVEKAMKMQSAHAYYLMGVLLQQGVGVKKDKKAALSYFRKAADMGNKYGQLASAQALRNAFVKKTTFDKQRGYTIAVEMLECSLSQDHAEAGYLLARHYLNFEKNPERGLFYLQKAAALGHVDSIYKLNSLFKVGKDGVVKDLERATCYDRVWDLIQAEQGRKFPDIDRLCPLPPLLLPR